MVSTCQADPQGIGPSVNCTFWLAQRMAHLVVVAACMKRTGILPTAEGPEGPGEMSKSGVLGKCARRAAAVATMMEGLRQLF